MILPVAEIVPHPPVRAMVYTNVPEAVGVPEMVTALEAQLPLTPAGRPLITAPVAPPVLYAIVVNAVFIQRVWASVPEAEPNAIVLLVTTFIDPEVGIVPHPPAKTIVYE